MVTIDFNLQDQNGQTHSLSQYKGKWIVLYFYPKDDTPGCTTEACNFRDTFHELQSLGAVILGVSKDSVESHKKFVQKFNLNFPLLSDEKQKVIKVYGAYNPIKTLRITFLIDPNGEIKKEYKNVNPTVHAKEIIEDIKTWNTSY